MKNEEKVEIDGKKYLLRIFKTTNKRYNFSDDGIALCRTKGAYYLFKLSSRRKYFIGKYAALTILT